MRNVDVNFWYHDLFSKWHFYLSGVCKLRNCICFILRDKTWLCYYYIFGYSFKNQNLQFHFQFYALTTLYLQTRLGKTSCLKREWIHWYITPNLPFFIQVSLRAGLYKIGITFYPFWFWSSLFRDLNDPILPSIFSPPSQFASYPCARNLLLCCRRISLNAQWTNNDAEGHNQIRNSPIYLVTLHRESKSMVWHWITFLGSDIHEYNSLLFINVSEMFDNQ